MGFPWGIAIGLLVLLVAYVLNRVMKDWLETENHTWLAVGGFLLFYAIAAGLVVYFSPTVGANASIVSIYDTLAGVED